MGRLKLLKFGFGAPQLFMLQQVAHKIRGDGFENSLRNVASHNGLAYLVSPQVGQFYKVMIMLKTSHLKEGQWNQYKNLKNSHYKALINFEVIDKSIKEKQVWEECVGYPGIRLKMTRSQKILIRYQTQRKFDRVQQQAQGFQSIIMQQGFDHLEAIDPLSIAKDILIKDDKLKNEHSSTIIELFKTFAQKRQEQMRQMGKKWSPLRRTKQFNRLRRELTYCISEESNN